MNTKELSIVIVSFNTKQVTMECIDSIYKYTTGVSFEVIIVDNNSSDGSADAIEASFPQVKLIRSQTNTGFASGQNLGILHTVGEFILVLNSDILFVENSNKILLDIFKYGDPRLGVIGPKILNKDGSHAVSGRRALATPLMLTLSVINRHFNFKKLLPKESLLRKNFGWFLGYFHDNYRSESTSYPVEYIDGMCALIRRKALEEVGLFDQRYFFDYEIIDLSNRIRSKGWKIEYHPSTQLIHLGHISRKKISRIVIETHKSELIYYRTYAPRTLPFLRISTVLVVGLKIALLKASAFFGKAKPELDIYKEIFRFALKDPLKTSSPNVPRI